MRFHDDCLVVDGHTDVPTRLFEEPADLCLRLPDRHVDLPRLRAGGVDALVWALFVPASLDPEAGLAHARKLYEISLAHLVPGEIEGARSASDVRSNAARGVISVLFGLENGRPLTVPGALDACARMGIRYVTLTHFGSHEWCDASTDEPRHGGLAPAGCDIVRRLNKAGILPDVSHVSDAAVEQVLEASRVPPIASHSSARALCDHPRNLPDPLIREIARAGGLVMANSFPAFVADEAAEALHERHEELGPELRELEERYFEEPGPVAREIARLFAGHPQPEVPLARYVDHVIHLIEIGGEEHTGIGTDFDGIPETLRGFEDVSKLPSLTAALLERGVDRSGVRRILGENFLAALEAAERAAD
ncbi:MAG TPA: dipeptidase [Thermoanaerobaculia bacterium]|nr:dipeptidase [Thermoanaerobaculia bacterium]